MKDLGINLPLLFFDDINTLWVNFFYPEAWLKIIDFLVIKIAQKS